MKPYVVAAHPRCGVAVALGGGASAVEIATWNNGTWIHDDTSWRGSVVAAAASAAELHVLYRGARGLEHATRGGGAPELVDPEGGGPGEMVIDAAGALHVVYVPSVGIGLRYAVRRGSWSVEQVDGRATIEPSIALGPRGAVLAAYEYLTSVEDHGCVLAQRSAGGWATQDLPRLDGHTSSRGCTGRVAPDGEVHVTFGAYRPEGLVLRHAVGNFDALRFETVERIASFGADAYAAALDGAGALHVAYRADASPLLKIAVLRGGAAPVVETVQPAVGAAGTVLAIDGAGVTHLVATEDGRVIHATRGPRR